MTPDKKRRPTPPEVRQALDLGASDFLLLEHTDRRAYKLVPVAFALNDQPWFRAEEEIASGRLGRLGFKLALNSWKRLFVRQATT